MGSGWIRFVLQVMVDWPQLSRSIYHGNFTQFNIYFTKYLYPLKYYMKLYTYSNHKNIHLLNNTHTLSTSWLINLLTLTYIIKILF